MSDNVETQRLITWLDDEVYAVLREHDAALVAVDAADEKEASPLVPTASWGYARLRRVEYGEGELERWAERLTEPAWEDAYVFFKHEDEGTGPKLARRFMDICGV